jgi:hypothetical protein
MTHHTSLEITINLAIRQPTGETAEVEIIDWQFDARPPERFRELPAPVRAAIWSKLRDEIDEFWFSAALEDHSRAAWNRLLEDVDLD